MTKRYAGSRRKTRHTLRKNIRARGKSSIRQFLQEFQAGQQVQLHAEPAIHSGLYFPRFHGKSGKIIHKRGNCYEVEIKDGQKKKLLIVHPVHLKHVA